MKTLPVLDSLAARDARTAAVCVLPHPWPASENVLARGVARLSAVNSVRPVLYPANPAPAALTPLDIECQVWWKKPCGMNLLPGTKPRTLAPQHAPTAVSRGFNCGKWPPIGSSKDSLNDGLRNTKSLLDTLCIKMLPIPSLHAGDARACVATSSG